MKVYEVLYEYHKYETCNASIVNRVTNNDEIRNNKVSNYDIR